MIGNDVQLAARLLTEGKLVAIPTETVYGLAANALNPDAVVSVFEAKNRPAFDPLIVHVASIEAAKHYVTSFSDDALKLASHFWPGPLTLVLSRKHIIPDLVTSGMESVAIRIPAHPMALALLSSLPFPLAAPSANPFGYVSPTTAAHVETQLKDHTAYILDGGPCNIGIESTIVDCTGEKPIILRLGGISPEQIEDILGYTVQLSLQATSNPLAPGQLDQHYSPMKPLYFGDIEQLMEKHAGKKIGILAFDKHRENDDIVSQFVLSESGDLHEAARRLFTGIRMLDHSPAEIILAEPAPTHGIGAAMNDRLSRAAVKQQKA